MWSALDQFLDQLPEGPVLVKIDTEGNELKVLNGMEQLIPPGLTCVSSSSSIRNASSANGPRPENLLQRLDELGFDVFVIGDPELRWRRYQPGTPWSPYMGVRTYRNLYCVPKAASLALLLFSHSSGLAGAERSLLERLRTSSAKGRALHGMPARPGPLAAELQESARPLSRAEYSMWCAFPGRNPPRMSLMALAAPSAGSPSRSQQPPRDRRRCGFHEYPHHTMGRHRSRTA